MIKVYIALFVILVAIFSYIINVYLTKKEEDEELNNLENIDENNYE